MTKNMFKTWAPRVAEHTFKHADDFGTDVGLAARIADFERVKGNWIGGIGRVEINHIFNPAFWHEAEVVDGEVAVRVDDTIALIIENIREREKFEHTRFTSTGLTDDVNVAGAVTTVHAELVVNPAEVSKAEGGDVLIVGGVASDEWELSGRFGSFRRSPNDVWCFDGSVR